MKAQHTESGVSLIEALVALAVMAFGMLGVIGMQGTLRFNADASKQRSEAVRLAQEEVERWRDFDVLTTAEGPQAFEAIASTSAATATLPGTAGNTTFSRSTTVAALSATDPLLKKVTVTVSWLNRRATSTTDVQTVTLTTMIAGIAPELAATLLIPGDQAATQRPLERHPTIPVGAVNQGTTSTFAPPGGGGVSWVFNNATGQIIQTCNPLCTAINAWLLTGFVHFAAVPLPASAALAALDAETPAGALIAGVGVSVNATAPNVLTLVCPTSTTATFITYYCAVPTTAGTRRWSGQSVVTGLALASNLADPSATLYKVCRYAPLVSVNGNQDHPLIYNTVTSSLTNQNFLVTLGGDGTTPYACPGDGPEPLVDSNTLPNQPDT